MRLKLITMLAAAALVAACSTPPEQSAGSGGSGGATGGSTGGTTTAPGGQASTPSATQVLPGSQQDLVANVGDRVFFDYDQFTLKPEARRTLDRQAEWMGRYPNVRLSIEGHADERGTREYNLALAERRAKSVKDYLVSKGINPNRVTTISYGKERPVALGSNELAWSQNRRGVSVVN
jgi:peptidoglycan-associated lipoprotein